MKLRLLSHASVVIGTADATVLTDPWFEGTAFDDSWALAPPADVRPDDLQRVSHVWITHEYPDHFHPRTLRSRTDEFKQRVEVLFQKNNSSKMFEAMRKLGYRHFRALPNRRWVRISPHTEIYCYQVGAMDSVLAVRDPSGLVLNVNDAEINRRDCAILAREVGRPDLVLNQFSIAGYSGEEDERSARLDRQASAILDNVIANHRDLNAAATCSSSQVSTFWSNTIRTNMCRENPSVRTKT